MPYARLAPVPRRVSANLVMSVRTFLGGQGGCKLVGRRVGEILDGRDVRNFRHPNYLDPGVPNPKFDRRAPLMLESTWLAPPIIFYIPKE